MREDLDEARAEMDLLSARYPAPEPDAEEIWRRVSDSRAAGRETRRRARRAIALRWTVAAGLAAVVAGALLVPAVRGAMDETVAEPVRSWSADRLSALGAWLGVRPGDDTDAPPNEPGSAPPASDRIETAPAAVLEVDVLRCQEEGFLAVQRYAGSVAVLESVERPGGAHLRRSSAGFTIANSAASVSSYRLLVPAGVRQVWIHVGSRSILLPMRAADPAGWTLFLQAPDGSAGAVGHCRP